MSQGGIQELTPVLSNDMVEEAIPGNIRKAEHFIAFLRRFIEYLKVSKIPDPADFTDTNASAACCRRNARVVPRSSQGDYVYRAEAAEVSQRNKLC